MTPSSGSAVARSHPSIMQMILEGRNWKARLTRNNNLRLAEVARDTVTGAIDPTILQP